jgi:hypothetical protein
MKQRNTRPAGHCRFVTLASTIGSLLVLAAVPWPAAGQNSSPEPIPLAATRLDSVPIGLPPEIRAEPGILDPVFALLVGLISANNYGTLTEERLIQELTRFPNRSRLPYRSVRSLTRLPVIPGRTASVRIDFNGPLDLPVPYSILGYHPGSFTATEECVFREWILGTVSLAHAEEVGGRVVESTIELEDVHLFGLARGKVVIDIDAWLDVLLGSMLDDTDVTCLLLCRYHGAWLAFAMGYNSDHEGRSGAFVFAKDEILFPSPPEMRTVGRQMRKRTEYLMSAWTEPKVMIPAASTMR